jgi:predicted DNA-binding transcriptional regulator AlpA
MGERALPGWPRGLSVEMAAAYVGLSPTTIQAERRAGRFPPPIHLTVGRLVWLRDDLDRWLDEKAGRVVVGDGSEWVA